jgi:hypothetical protein
VAALLSLEEFTTRTNMPSPDVALVETNKPGFIATRLAFWSSWIESRLRKRYAVPFSTPTPELVLGWLVDLVNPDVYRARGWNPGEAQSASIEQARTDALAALKEAADGELGLYDIPLREDSTTSGISRGGPLCYSEASPYDWIDRQKEAIRGR